MCRQLCELPHYCLISQLAPNTRSKTSTDNCSAVDRSSLSWSFSLRSAGFNGSLMLHTISVTPLTSLWSFTTQLCFIHMGFLGQYVKALLSTNIQCHLKGIWSANEEFMDQTWQPIHSNESRSLTTATRSFTCFPFLYLERICLCLTVCSHETKIICGWKVGGLLTKPVS